MVIKLANGSVWVRHQERATHTLAAIVGERTRVYAKAQEIIDAWEGERGQELRDRQKPDAGANVVRLPWGTVPDWVKEVG